MRVRLSLIISGLVLVLVLFMVVLRISKPENPFPLSVEAVEKALEKHNLQWEIGESKSFSDGNTNYEVLNESGKITTHIDSSLANNEKGELGGTASARRFLEVMLVPPPTYESKLTSSIEEEQWPTVFSLACSLYGGSRNSKKVFRQFTEDTKNERYEPKGRKIVWEKKISGVYYLVSFRPSEKHYGRFDLLSIKLMNDVCYKDYLAMTKRFEEKQVISNEEKQRVIPN
ncbi:hypothetical protein [Hydrogenoanaerobacterium sp.]|uniref:hypothetical protein n=1 Tax=Hydrogenoanaerobacterium sp. TaxID=2953763 RepID=UPI0028A1EF27|nr:hypothetical protein [Hydrogenoanaerobacterium sp.]